MISESRACSTPTKHLPINRTSRHNAGALQLDEPDRAEHKILSLVLYPATHARGWAHSAVRYGIKWSASGPSLRDVVRACRP
jgi:hypothetical protein